MPPYATPNDEKRHPADPKKWGSGRNGRIQTLASSITKTYQGRILRDGQKGKEIDIVVDFPGGKILVEVKMR
jgi:hypothetical protein